MAKRTVQEEVQHVYQELKEDSHRYKNILKWVLISGAVFVALLIIVVLISVMIRSPRRSFTPGGRY